MRVVRGSGAFFLRRSLNFCPAQTKLTIRRSSSGRPQTRNRSQVSTIEMSNTTQDTGLIDELEPYARRHPLEVARRLRELAAQGMVLTLSYGAGQMTTRVLAVHERSFVFDAGMPEQNRAMLGAARWSFRATPDGVTIKFSTACPRETTLDDRPALEADLPDVLYHIQRREYFRVPTPATKPYLCRGALRDVGEFEYEVHNLSLGGLGLCTFDAAAAEIPLGTRLGKVEVDLRDKTRVELDVTLVSRRESDALNGKRRYHLGVRINSFSGPAENILQRRITELEMRLRSIGANNS